MAIGIPEAQAQYRRREAARPVTCGNAGIASRGKPTIALLSMPSSVHAIHFR